MSTILDYYGDDSVEYIDRNAYSEMSRTTPEPELK